MKILLSLNSFCLIFLAVFNAEAADYSVQIATYKNPSLFDADNAETLGNVVKVGTGFGLTRIQIGPYATKSEALAVRDQAITAGYLDAFVTGGSAVATSRLDTATIGGYNSVDRRLSAARAKVNADQFGDIVLLDGRFNLKQGSDFTPLE